MRFGIRRLRKRSDLWLYPQAAIAVPDPALHLACQLRAQAAIAIPDPTFLLAFLSWAQWWHAALVPPVPDPALLLAYVRRTQALRAIPDPALLLAFLSRAQWRRQRWRLGAKDALAAAGDCLDLPALLAQRFCLSAADLAPTLVALRAQRRWWWRRLPSAEEALAPAGDYLDLPALLAPRFCLDAADLTPTLVALRARRRLLGLRSRLGGRGRSGGG